MDVCRQCDGPIIWAHTEAGNMLPLDANPSPLGTHALVDGVAHVIKDTLFEPHYSGGRHTEHRATCPKVERKGRK